MIDGLANSVIAVPPLARNPDLTVNRQANAALIRHIEHGGVRTLMYGGNANFQNIGLYEYGAVLDMLLELADHTTRVIPSVGPDFGKMMDQAELLRTRPFSGVMILPAKSAYTPPGLEEGIRRLADRLGRAVILYVRSEDYLSPVAIERIVASGAVECVKYAVIRNDPRIDPFLRELVSRIGGELVISGIGERPAVTHLHYFRVASFTSGSVCIAPRLSQSILAAARKQDFARAEALRALFLPLEDCRDRYDPIRVLHDAVTLSDIADMGPMLPLMSNLDEERLGEVRHAARTLLQSNNQLIGPA